MYECLQRIILDPKKLGEKVLSDYGMALAEQYSRNDGRTSVFDIGWLPYPIDVIERALFDELKDPNPPPQEILTKGSEEAFRKIPARLQEAAGVMSPEQLRRLQEMLVDGADSLANWTALVIAGIYHLDDFVSSQELERLEWANCQELKRLEWARQELERLEGARELKDETVQSHLPIPDTDYGLYVTIQKAEHERRASSLERRQAQIDAIMVARPSSRKIPE